MSTHSKTAPNASDDEEPRLIPPRSHSSLSIHTSRSRSTQKSNPKVPEAIKNRIHELKDLLEDARYEIRIAKNGRQPEEAIASLRARYYAIKRELNKTYNLRDRALEDAQSSHQPSPSPSPSRQSRSSLESAYVALHEDARYATRPAVEDVHTAFNEYNGHRAHATPHTPAPPREDVNYVDPNISAAHDQLSAGRRPGESLQDFQARQNAFRRQSWSIPPHEYTPSVPQRQLPGHVLANIRDREHKSSLNRNKSGRTRIIRPPVPGTTPGLLPAEFTPRPASQTPVTRQFLAPRSRRGSTSTVEEIKIEENQSPSLHGSNASIRAQPPSHPRTSTPRSRGHPSSAPPFEPPVPPIPPVPPNDGDPNDPSDSGRNSNPRGGDRHEPPRHNQNDRNSRPPSRLLPRPPGPPDDPSEPPNDGHSHHTSNSRRSGNNAPHRPTAVFQERRTPFGVIPPSNERLPGEEYFDYRALDYDPNIPLRDRVFGTFADRIEYRLYQKRGIINDPKARRELVNSMPKLTSYDGECSVLALDTFLRGLIERCRVLGLTGPPRIQDDDGIWAITNEDANRTILLGANLVGTAKSWFDEIIDEVPSTYYSGGDYREHDYTFMEVFRGLFNRFILQDTLHEMKRVFKSITYCPEGGARRLFAELHLCAKRMPEPPSLNKFKVAIVRRLPQEMRVQLGHAGMTPEDNSVNEIMQKALSLEKGWNANNMYPASVRLRSQTVLQAKVERPTSRREEKQPASSSKATTGQSEVTKRVRLTYKNSEGACFACGKKGHFMNDKACEKYVAGAPRLAAIVEDDTTSSESGDPYRVELFSDELIDASADEAHGAIREELSVFDDNYPSSDETSSN
ncbi:hypothetical protein VNI00_014016 [Paramarasmius palmivorus]|uniref:Gag protein n=1 Tax=Paramarasmius palmivorus TaxID=297713 RepID=A0AAW0BWF6_9AGAR